ncbi:MAG: ABC-2 family transporter protein [Clostridia bacterium]|nr:ABC-2 family transporter protein [Clostridia bacterium]
MAVKNNLKLIFSYYKLNLKKEWKYKTSFFMQIIMMILNDLFFIIQWFIIFQLVDNIGGYGFNETMLLWAVAAGGYGFSHAFFGGAWKIKDIIYDGKLDVYLTQPKNILINVCCSSTEIAALGDILYAFVTLAIIGAPWYWFLIMIPAMILSGLVYVSVYVVYATICFYVKRGDAVAKSVEGTLNKAGNYPPAIFNTVVKSLFFTIIPTFFFTFVPAQYFFMTPNIWWILVAFAVTTLWVVLAFVLFKLGLKKYNSGNLMSGRL